MSGIAASKCRREDFPALHQEVNGHRLAYLDNAATTHRPKAVIEAMQSFYERDNANVHRGVHSLSQAATEAYERARDTLRDFIGASEREEIIFTKGCTEAINLVASSWVERRLDGHGPRRVRRGTSAPVARRTILVGEGEHHANIVPWQMAAERHGLRIVPIPVLDSGELDMQALASLLGDDVLLVAIKHVCNATGAVNPVASIVRAAHAVGARVLVDGAQALAHQPVNVAELDVDFYAISGHKLYGPMGIGALYAKRELLEEMPPYQTGGSMIRSVSFEETTFADSPERFEPGTPNVAGAIGLAAAIDYVKGVGLDAIADHELRLKRLARRRLSEIEGIRLYGPEGGAAIVSFSLGAAHPHDVGTILDRRGVAVRAGHHCCQPLMRRLGVTATVRASFALGNDDDDVDQLMLGVGDVARLFA
jgi:cysteine desulfurase/selenocysteine lyase